MDARERISGARIGAAGTSSGAGPAAPAPPGRGAACCASSPAASARGPAGRRGGGIRPRAQRRVPNGPRGGRGGYEEPPPRTPGPAAAGAHLEVGDAAADLVDVGQRAAVVGAPAVRQPQLLRLQLGREGRRGRREESRGGGRAPPAPHRPAGLGPAAGAGTPAPRRRAFRQRRRPAAGSGRPRARCQPRSRPGEAEGWSRENHSGEITGNGSAALPEGSPRHGAATSTPSTDPDPGAACPRLSPVPFLSSLGAGKGLGPARKDGLPAPGTNPPPRWGPEPPRRTQRAQRDPGSVGSSPEEAAGRKPAAANHRAHDQRNPDPAKKNKTKQKINK